MKQKRQKISSVTYGQALTDYRRVRQTLTRMQETMQDDLIGKLSDNIGMTFTDFDTPLQYESGNRFVLTSADAEVTGEHAFVQLYFVTDDIPSMMQEAEDLSAEDTELLRNFRRGKATARQLFLELQTIDFHLFVRRYIIALDSPQLVDIYNSPEVFVERNENGFEINP